MGSIKFQEITDRLGNPILLKKVDQLRELGVSSLVPLPQLVVVGDQSAGKSSVLTGLTGFAFPRAVSLCTRYATEIICRRDDRSSTSISIRPDPNSSQAHQNKVRAFRRDITDLNGEEFEAIFDEAAKVMGIRSSHDSSNSAPAFSLDVLRVEICSPEQDHLTVIDVPGIFRNATPGITTDSDIAVVDSMVKSYIKDPRTIILAVVPCNVDIATAEILKLAKEADPEGKRTLGVLTKPDLAIESAAQKIILDLVKGNRKDLQLGYCVVRNQGADQQISRADRDAQEKAFFLSSPLRDLDKSRVGICALRSLLSELLMDRTRSEFPQMIRDIKALREGNRKQLDQMGPSRSDTNEQRAYLMSIVEKFKNLKGFAVSAYYTGDEIFESRSDLKLITRIRRINDAFSTLFYRDGHKRQFESFVKNEVKALEISVDTQDGDDGLEIGSVTRAQLYDDLGFSIPAEDIYPELDNVLADAYKCLDPQAEGIREHIRDVFTNSQGLEISSFGPNVIPTAFKEQSEKWEPMTLAHVSNAILIIHHFIDVTLKEICSDEQARSQLWDFLESELTSGYVRALEKARFLLKAERQGRAMTSNPEFGKILSKARAARTKAQQMKVPSNVDIKYSSSGNAFVEGNSLMQSHISTTNPIQHTCDEIHDNLKAYYEVVRGRFVDNVCQQAVAYFLIDDEDGPLSVLSSKRILEMDTEQLEMIAGEDAATKRQRQMFQTEVDTLTKAMKVLKS